MAVGWDPSEASKTRRRAAIALCLLVSGAGCRGSGLAGVTGKLQFSTPDDPAALSEPDAGLVLIDFGQVIVGGTETLAVDLTSVGSSVTLGATAAVQPDAEFTLPFQSGTAVGATPVAVTMSFSPTSAGTKTAVFQLTDYSPGTAVVVIQMTGEGVPSGLTVSPNPVDFGEVEINQTQSVPVTITNNSALPASLVIGSVEGPDAKPFTLGAPSATALAPNASATLNAVFAPLVVGDAGASFTIGGWTGSPPFTVNLTGIGAKGWLEAISPVDFGFVQLGSTVVKSAQIKNVGSYTTLHVIAPAPDVSQNTGSTAFSLASALPSLPLALAPGQSASVQVAFAPTSLDAYTGAVFFTTDDPDAPYPAVQLEGYGGGPRIRCQPRLAFEHSPIGYPSTEPAVCTNIGADIPSHPEIKLVIAQTGVSTDDAAFSARLGLPDGGLAGPNDSVGLSSGQSATLKVSFEPQDAGVYEGRLRVVSNDINDADAGMILTGQGLVPGPCTLEAIPSEVSFGDVPPGGIGTQLLELENTGENLCIVTHVALDPTSAAGFSLPQGELDDQILSYPGDPDNPAGRPLLLRIPVQFASSGLATISAGTIDIAAPNASPPKLSVSLTASSAYGCFTVVPTSADFGTNVFSPVTQQLCTPANKMFWGVNSCGAPVTVSEVMALGTGADGGSQLAFTPDLFGNSPPITVIPGDQLTFQVGFTPRAPGAASGSLLVTSSDSPKALTVASLEGDAELGNQRTDTFIVPAPPKELDLVWILDNDDDLPQVQSVAAVLPQLIDSLNKAQIDWQMAVTSTDTCDGGSSDIGFFEPCDHCISQASSAPLYLAQATADAGDALVNLFNLFDQDPQVGFCNNRNGDEHFFDTIADAFSTDNLAGHNAGFLRPGADLAIVVVNGDAEDDPNDGETSGSSYLTNLQQVTSLVGSLKPDAGMASVSYINSGAGNLLASQRIGQLVQATNGSEIDSTQPAAVWQSALVDLFAFGNGVAPFRLSAPATFNGGIQVSVDGTQVTGWSFDPYQNAIIFDPSSLPAPGSTVTVTYRLGCQ